MLVGVVKLVLGQLLGQDLHLPLAGQYDVPGVQADVG